MLKIGLISHNAQSTAPTGIARDLNAPAVPRASTSEMLPAQRQLFLKCVAFGSCLLANLDFLDIYRLGEQDMGHALQDSQSQASSQFSLCWFKVLKGFASCLVDQGNHVPDAVLSQFWMNIGGICVRHVEWPFIPAVRKKQEIL